MKYLGSRVSKVSIVLWESYNEEFRVLGYISGTPLVANPHLAFRLSFWGLRFNVVTSGW